MMRKTPRYLPFRTSRLVVFVLLQLSLITWFLNLSGNTWKIGVSNVQYRAPETIKFPDNIKEIQINIGPNVTPIKPPADESVGVLAIEANTAIANQLRVDLTPRYRNRFFVINAAVSGTPLAGTVAMFYYYNKKGLSSSLSVAARPTWKNITDAKYWSGNGDVDFVPVLSLESILSAISSSITISLLKIDTQGHDFLVITSASLSQLQRVKKIISETYLPNFKSQYENVSNSLEKEWIPFMKSVGFDLLNPPQPGVRSKYEVVPGEYDAIWLRSQAG